MKHIHIVNPYNSFAMQRMIAPLLSELPRLYEVTVSETVNFSADLNIHVPWHTLAGLEKLGESKHIAVYTHCNPPDEKSLYDACERADLVVCMSYTGRRELIELGADPRKLWVNYAAADNFQYRKRIIGVVGSAQPNGRKREHLLIDLAWKYDLSAFQILLIGNGWDDMRNELDSLGVSAITAKPDDEKLKNLYSLMDCLLVTGYVEGGPLPLLEAMASGVYVLSPQFGYAADLLNDAEIYGTIEELHEKLSNITKASVLNHQVARSWSWNDYAAEYALLIGRMLDETADLYPERGHSRYAQLYDLVTWVKPKRICEIGVWNGTNALRMLQCAARSNPMNELHYQGFDLFNDQTGEHLRRELSKNGWPRTVVERRLNASGANIELIEGDTKDTLNTGIGFKQDFIFVDGGHSEATIQNDANAVLQLFQYSPKAVIVFDDYYHAGKPEGMGCNNMIDSLGSDYLVEHLPVRTKTEDGREIGMVKVTYAAIPVQRWETYTFGSSLYVGGTPTNLPEVREDNAPGSFGGGGDLERLTATFGE